MIRILGTIFAGLLGLAFGSFLNVCLSRWPADESVVSPRSHCRNCDHTLAWWENIPLVSWLILRGRCRRCRAWIGSRYPLVELAVGVLWALEVWRTMVPGFARDSSISWPPMILIYLLGTLALLWLLVALAILDLEYLWLPNWLTLPGFLLGYILYDTKAAMDGHVLTADWNLLLWIFVPLIGPMIAAGLILLIRWLYKLIRHREGIGLGDAKLMALLAAWLGLPGALLAFVLGTILAALGGLVVIAVPSARTNPQSWATSKLPLGTFLCIGGIVSSLWGQPIIAAYLHWTSF
jgi:leader peptidase (prepilin peptidase)/N-methyltransferase